MQQRSDEVDRRPVVDMRLVPPALGIWIGAGYGLHASGVFGAALVILCCALLVYCRRQLRWFAGAAMLGIVVAVLRVTAADPAMIGNLVDNAGEVSVEVVVNSEPHRRERETFGGLTMEPQWSFRATLITIDAADRIVHTSLPVTVVTADELPFADVGATLRGRAILHPDDASRRSTYRVSLRNPDLLRPPSRGSWLATSVRNSLADALRAQATDARAGATLLPGLVLGDTRAQSPELVEQLRVSGLSHLTAVSGANVAIVLGAVLWLLQRTRLGRRPRDFILIGVLGAFVVVVQPEPSVLRAAVMGAISVYAIATGAARHSASALWLSVVVLLIIDPFMAWQFGFALSVAATAGLIVIQPWLSEQFPERAWMSLLLVTISAQIATLPMLLAMGSPPTWLSIPANVLTAPLVAPATISGFVATVIAALALLPGLGTILTPLAGVVAWPGVLLADVIASIAARGAGSAFAVSPFAKPWTAMLFIGMCGIAWKLRRRLILVASLALVVALVTSLPRPGGWPPDDWWYAVCDVGQGDASVIRTGERSAIVVDVGPDARALRRCLGELGVHQVPALVITHFHADHVEGMRGLLAVADVGTVFRSESVEPRVEYERTVAVLQQPMTVLSQGQQIRAGSVRLQVLWPPAHHLDGDPNTDSVVLLLETPRGRILLGADADTDAQVQFIPPQVDVVKVPHHGSKYQAPTFLRATNARLAIISVGRDNSYGHPAVETVQQLQSNGALVLRTDQRGSVAVVGSGLSYAAERD